MKKNLKWLLILMIIVVILAVVLVATFCGKDKDVDVQKNPSKNEGVVQDDTTDKNDDTTDKKDDATDKKDDATDKNDATNNKPSNNKPSNNKPSNNKPSNNKPSNNKPSNNKPSNNNPSNNNPGGSVNQEDKNYDIDVTINKQESLKPTVKVDVDFSKLTYTAFGDSITFGADYSNGYAQMAEPYPQLVGKTLKLATVKNMGIPGGTFCRNNNEILSITHKILGYKEKTDIISVLLGVNDYNGSFPLGKMGDKTTKTIYGSLYLIAEHLTTTHKDAFVFFMTPYKSRSGWSNNTDYELADVVKAIKIVGAKYGIPVLDLHNTGQFENVEMNNSDNDGLHPSQEFMRNYAAPQIAQFIKDYYQ